MLGVAIYFSWDRQAEVSAPLARIEDRFSTLYEWRRTRWPLFDELRETRIADQGIGGFIEHVLLQNFSQFIGTAGLLSGRAPTCAERHDGVHHVPLSADWLSDAGILIIISFDSMGTNQVAREDEVEAVRSFLSDPRHFVFVCPHHDIGSSEDTPNREADLAEFQHHGDRAIPPRQAFGGFASTLLSALGVPVRSRFGLRPAMLDSGEPAPIEVDSSLDRYRLLDSVTALNHHPHLPHLERVGDSLDKMEVLARQAVDGGAPPHPYFDQSHFDALLQSRDGVFAGGLLVCDATLWSSNAGGLEQLSRFWRNVMRLGSLDAARGPR